MEDQACIQEIFSHEEKKIKLDYRQNIYYQTNKWMVNRP